MKSAIKKSDKPKSRAEHLGQHRWKKGESGNISGRPSEIYEGMSLREMIFERTNNFSEVVDRAISLMRQDSSQTVALGAVQWLADRVWGKAVETQITAHANIGPTILANLSVEELRALATGQITMTVERPVLPLEVGSTSAVVEGAFVTQPTDIAQVTEGSEGTGEKPSNPDTPDPKPEPT